MKTILQRIAMFHVKQLLLLTAFLPFIAISQHGSGAAIPVRTLPPLPSTDTIIENYVNSFAELKKLPKGYYDWFYWTNYSRQHPKKFWDSVVVPLLNTYPQFNTSYALSLKKDLFATSSLPLIKPNRALMKMALAHARDLAIISSGNLSHTSSDGTTAGQRFSNAGIQKCSAENLVTGSTPAFSLFLLYVDQGVPEVGHRKNLLNPVFVEMGIGIAKAENNRFVNVQDFACDQTK